MGSNPRAPAQEEMIQLLLAESLLGEQSRTELTGCVLGKLQDNARAAGWPEPEAILITAVDIQRGHTAARGDGEAVANIGYRVVP